MGVWANRAWCWRAGVVVGLGGAEFEIIGGAAEDSGRALSVIALEGVLSIGQLDLSFKTRQPYPRQPRRQLARQSCLASRQ